MTDRSETVIRHRRRSSLTGIDFLVIVAIILTFAAIVGTTLGRTKDATYNGATVPGFSNDSANFPTKLPTTPA